MPPPVTWLLPVRNGERYLEQTLRSIAEQDYPNHEVLVWDDGSYDGTQDILSRWLGKQVQGRVVRKERVGLGRALAHLVVEAKTELLARIDADDIAEPNRLKEQARFLIDNRRTGLVGSAMSVIGQPNRLIDQPNDDATLRWALRFKNPVNHPSVMLRRSAVLEVGNYRPLAAGREDYDLWARLALIVRFANLPQPLTRYRLHDASATAGWSSDHGASFYHQRNGLVDRLLPGTPPSNAIRLLDLVRNPEDLSVTADDLMRFRMTAMLAAKACRYKPTYFTQTHLFEQQYENLKTRRLKGTPLIRPVWPLLKHANRLLNKPKKTTRNGNTAA